MKTRNHDFMSKFIFLCIITTSIVTTFSFSRFQSTLTGNPGKSRVAVPVLNVELISKSEETSIIDCNTNDTSVSYEIVISNEKNNVISEVSLKYGLKITMPTEIPDGLDVRVDGELATQKGDTYTVKNIGRFNSNKYNENTHIVTFEVDSDIAKSNIFEDITIMVYAEQID